MFEAWGGLLEVMYTQFTEDEVPSEVQVLAKKIKAIEETKTIEDVKYTLHFTKKEINYLNSPLLDEIYDTIFSEDVVLTTMKKDKLKAFIFYSERAKICTDSFMQMPLEESGAVKILRYIFTEKPSERPSLDSIIYSLVNFFTEYFPNNEALKLLYFEMIPEITEDLMTQLKECDYDACNYTENIQNIIFEKIKTVEAAEQFVLYLLEEEDIEDFSMLKKTMEKFPNTPLQTAIKKYAPRCDISYELLQYEKCKDPQYLDLIFIDAVEGCHIDLLKLLKREYKVNIENHANLLLKLEENSVKNEIIDIFCDNTENCMILLKYAFREKITYLVNVLNKKLCSIVSSL